MRNYIDTMDTVQTQFKSVEMISENVTTSIRKQASAFDDLRESTGAAEPSLDDVVDALEDVKAESDEISFYEIARAAEDLEGTVIPIFDNITQGLSDIQDGARVDHAFVDVGLNIAEHFIPGFEAATAFLDTMQQIDELLSTGIRPESAFEGVNRAQGFQLPGESDEAFERRIQRLRELGIFDEGDIRTRQAASRRREGEPDIERASVRPDRRRRDRIAGRQGYRPPGTRYNATTGEFEPIPFIFDEDASGGSGLGAPRPVEPEALVEATEPSTDAEEILRSVFRFSQEQRGILAPLEQNVRNAQDFIDNFITADSSPEEVQAAYTALANAEQTLYNEKIGFINNAVGITELARENALQVEESIFNREIREANDDSRWRTH